MSAVVVADASPLIAFQQIGQLQLLRTMFGELTVPPTPWIVERRLAQPIAPLVLRANLGAGESEALSLAVEIRADLFFVDERAGRRVAAALGVSVVGTLGVLLAAKRTGNIAEVRPVVDELLRHGFWVAPRLVRQALLAAAEEGPGGDHS